MGAHCYGCWKRGYNGPVRGEVQVGELSVPIERGSPDTSTEYLLFCTRYRCASTQAGVPRSVKVCFSSDMFYGSAARVPNPERYTVARYEELEERFRRFGRRRLGGVADRLERILG